MKTILVVLLFFVLVSPGLAQDPESIRNRKIECTVFFVEDAVKAEKSTDDRLRNGVEIGRFIAHCCGEGAFTSKRFRAGKSNLFVFASVNFDDDLTVDDSLTFAMTMSLGITRSAGTTRKSYIAASDMQIEYGNAFNAANLDVSLNQRVKYSAARLRCERKK